MQLSKNYDSFIFVTFLQLSTLFLMTEFNIFLGSFRQNLSSCLFNLIFYFYSFLFSSFLFHFFIGHFVSGQFGREVSFNMNILFILLQVLLFQELLIRNRVEVIIKVNFVFPIKETLISYFFHPIFGHCQDWFGKWIC